ncbi:threonine synthase, partial [mine drainage metagenome]
MADLGSRLEALECRACGQEIGPDRLVGICPNCGHTLFARYRTDGFDARAWWASLGSRPWSLWRYREMLPVRSAEAVTTRGGGCTSI